MIWNIPDRELKSQRLKQHTREGAKRKLNTVKKCRLCIHKRHRVFCSDTESSIKRNDFLVTLKAEVPCRELDSIGGLISLHIYF